MGGNTTPPKFSLSDQSKCTISKSQLRPLVVEWASADRASLEEAVEKGPIVVRYVGCTMELLPRCSAVGRFDYRNVTMKKDHVKIRDADDLYANVPLGAAKLEGTLKSSGELNVKMTIVGRYRLDRDKLKADELKGSECETATHFVNALTVGAFDFYAGASDDAKASVSVLGVGAGAGASSSRQVLNQDGEEAKCKSASPEDPKPPQGCGAILRLELAAIEGAQPPMVRNAPPDTKGSVSTDSSTEPPKSGPSAQTSSQADSTLSLKADVSVGGQKAKLSWLPWLGFGLGAVGLGMGTITGVMASSKASQLKTDCPENRCAPGKESDISSMRTMATLSNVGFVVGGVGLAAGTVAFILLRKKADKKGAFLAPVVTPAYTGMTGSISF